jgi:hypothetical protein
MLYYLFHIDIDFIKNAFIISFKLFIYQNIYIKNESIIKIKKLLLTV